MFHIYMSQSWLLSGWHIEIKIKNEKLVQKLTNSFIMRFPFNISPIYTNSVQNIFAKISYLLAF